MGRIHFLVSISILSLFLAASPVGADAIHDAAANGDVVSLRRLLQENPSLVNQQTPEGKTALLWAAIRGQTEAARILVAAGADVNKPQIDGWTPLHASVCDGNDEQHLEIARLLLSKNAKVSAPRQDGWTPLLAASLKGNVEGMRLLLAHGASLAEADVKGSLALHFAVYGAQPAPIRFLLEKGSDPLLKNKEGASALDMALTGANADVIDALVSTKPIELTFDQQRVSEALKRLFEPLHVPYVVDDPISGSVSVELNSLGFTKSLAALLRSVGNTHTFEIKDGVFHIKKRTGPPPQEQPLPLSGPHVDGRNYRFDRAISREVLNNYLSRAVTHYGLCSTSPEPVSACFEDDMRMLLNLGAKFIGRSAYAWVPPTDDEAHFRLAKERADRVHKLDPDIILQAAVFEAVYEDVEKIPVPDWVFEEFGLPVEKRMFKYAAMLYGGNKYRNHWTQGASVPDMTKLETRMYFYYRGRRYIDAGFEAIHFGQVHLMDESDGGHKAWWDMLSRLRKYASKKARRHIVLCDAHTNGEVVDGNRLLFDYHAFPLIGQDVDGSPMKVKLVKRYYNAIYGRSAGGITPSGWSCDWAPYICEFDCAGSSDKPGQPSKFPFNWGYSCADWFVNQPEAYRKQYLVYARTWLRDLHEDGWLQMPTRLDINQRVEGQQMWHANTRSPSCPFGFNMEDTIRAIWRSEEQAGASRAIR